MRWFVLSWWLGSVLFLHYRGRVRLPLLRQLQDHSALLAPVNAVLLLASRPRLTPWLSLSEVEGLDGLAAHWETIRDEALALARDGGIKAPEHHDDVAFRSFFKRGWKRFYLCWYGASHPSAERLCPRTVELLGQVPGLKAAMFAVLPAGGRLRAHRDPFAGSLRYHLGLWTPNDDRCFIEVDGERYSWRDGKAVLFDETFVHEAWNHTDRDRIILFCDIERPLRWRWARRFNRWFGRVMMSAASSPNEDADTTGLVNRLGRMHWAFEQRRRAFSREHRLAYRALKVAAIGFAAWALLR